jgi:hypothetical protein
LPSWENRIVGYESVNPTALIANPLNWRVHPTHQQESMLAVLRTIGWVAPVTVNKSTGVIIDGHLRVALAIERKLSSVPVAYVELSEIEEKEVLATFDVIGQMAQKDEAKYEALASEIAREEDLDQVIVEMIEESDRAGKRRKNETLVPECTISPELHERQDYLLFVFDHEFDWAVACERIGVKAVVSAQVGQCSAGRRGTGRVIQGKVLVKKLTAGTA